MTKLFVYFIFLKCHFFFLFRIKSKYYYAGKNLYGKSFRLGASAENDVFIILKEYFRTIKRMRKGSDKLNNIKNLNVILDGDEKSFELRKKYIEHHDQIEIDLTITKNDLLTYKNRLDFFGFIFYISLITLLFLPFSVLFRKKRTSIALMVKEFVENTNLLNTLSKNQIKHVYHFCVYEKDSNFTTLLLEKKKIKTTKITSEVPICIWNQTIICDRLCLSIEYQFEEIEYFKKSIFYNKVELWSPERILNINLSEKKLNTNIGFYSTASWVRNKLNHIDQGVNMINNELELLTHLKEYILTHSKENQLIIYLHPKEKKYPNFEDVKNHYSEILNGIEFTFASLDKNSADCFHEIDLAIAFNSTLVYERLYFGFKTLLYPKDVKNFPVPDSPMRNICAFDKKELFNKLSKNVSYTRDEFFEKNSINNYRNKIK